MSTTFRTCSCCGTQWESRAAFLADPAIVLIGYQVNFQELMAGFFLFNHSCGTTLGLTAEQFRDLYQGPIFEARDGECQGHCLHQEDLEPCPTICDCAFVRELMVIIRDWPKKDKIA